MIKTEKITKIFHQKHNTVTALKEISIEIKDGEFVSITGPSGSGKSTLLLLLGGMIRPDNGNIFWNKESIFDWKMKERTEWRADTIGFIFQTFNLIPYLSVYDNVNIALELSGNKDIKEESILDIIKKMKLSDRLEHKPSELSVGQQQRVAFARALIKNPQVILADEPTGNLDPQTTSEMMDILKDINKQGKTVVLITHDPKLAKIAKRNIHIVDGEIKK
jgi:putative ABC transport system ATP-binding protein